VHIQAEDFDAPGLKATGLGGSPTEGSIPRWTWGTPTQNQTHQKKPTEAMGNEWPVKIAEKQGTTELRYQ
jgi:hypothetical protein